MGEKEVGFHKDGESIIERKVPLPTKWIKGLTTVQHFFSDSSLAVSLTKAQAITLFRSVNLTKVKTDYYLVKRGTKYQLSPLSNKDTVCIGGIHRLALLKPLLTHVDAMHIYNHNADQAVSFVLEMGAIRFTFSISRSYLRGFSGEGAVLDDLLEEMPADLITAFDNYSFANQEFNHQKLAKEHKLDIQVAESLSAKLAAMGLLGYDLGSANYYYRRLPFKMNRILSLNPRLKGAENLIKENKVTIKVQEADRIEANVNGTNGFDHFVLLKNGAEKCTCLWYTQNQGERGSCKHILAVKKMTNNS